VRSTLRSTPFALAVGEGRLHTDALHLCAPGLRQVRSTLFALAVGVAGELGAGAGGKVLGQGDMARCEAGARRALHLLYTGGRSWGRMTWPGATTA
jgi:hypothetical protein